MLSPYQDLVYFCIPTQEELKFIEETHERYKKLIEKFDKKDCDFYNWIEKGLLKENLYPAKSRLGQSYQFKTGFAAAGVKYLLKMAASFPGT